MPRWTAPSPCQPGEEFCYNDLDQGALKDQIGDLLFIAVYKDVEVVEPTPAPSEEPTPAPSEEPTPAPSEEPTPAPSEEPTEPTPAPSEQPTAEPTAAPTAQPETPADNNDDNTTTVTSDNSDDVGEERYSCRQHRQSAASDWR